jgi:hypothetical protein
MKYTKLAAALAALMIVTGCASNADYARYVDSQKEIQVAKSNAEAERYKAMGAIAQTGDTTTKVAAMFAMQNATAAPQQQSGAGIAAPKSGWDSAREWASFIFPSMIQFYGIHANKEVSITQSNNSKDVAVSTNQTFSTLGTNIQTTATSLAGFIQAPAANVTTTNTNTIGGDGVVGSGTMSKTDSHNVTTTTTTDNHAVTTSDNHTTNPAGKTCTVNVAGVLTCI